MSASFTSLTPPTPGTNLVWNTNALISSGILSVALGQVHPQLATAAVSGTDLILNGNGGAAGYGVSVLSTTNLSIPQTNWPVVGSGFCDRLGAFNFTNAISPDAPVKFYLIRIP